MKKVIYLHIGLEKTGTKSIQKFCYKNGKYLMENGVYYPHGKKEPYMFFTTHWPLVSAVSERKKFLPAKKVFEPEFVYGKLIEDIEKNDCKKVLLSAEPFSSHAVEKKRIQKIKDQLVNYDVKVILYLRRQDTLFISSKSTNVKGGRHFPGNYFDFNEAIERDDLYNFKSIVDNWSYVFGKENMIINIFDRKELKDGNVICDIMDIVGVPVLKEMLDTDDKNTSLSIECLYFLNQINMHEILDNKQRTKINKVLEKYDKGNTIKSLIPGSQKKAIMHHYQEQNRYVANEYFERDYLFEENKISSIQDEKQYSMNENDIKSILEYLKNQKDEGNIDEELFGKIDKAFAPFFAEDSLYVLEDEPLKISSDVKNIEYNDGVLTMESNGIDPWFILPKFRKRTAKRLFFKFEVEYSCASTLDIYYRRKTWRFKEKNKVRIGIGPGRSKNAVVVDSKFPIGCIRIDLGDTEGTFKIHFMEVFK